MSICDTVTIENQSPDIANFLLLHFLPLARFTLAPKAIKFSYGNIPQDFHLTG
jgi:hypothetical protein